MAYYDRDFDAALRLADAAVAAAGDEERRTSSLTLAGRARHSRGDLAGAAADLEAAVRQPGAGRARHRRGVARRAAGPPGPARRGARAVRTRSRRRRRHAPSVRDPARHVLARLRPRDRAVAVAEALDALESWDAAVDDLGPAGARFRPVVDNFWAWILGAIGRARRSRGAQPDRAGRGRPVLRAQAPRAARPGAGGRAAGGAGRGDRVARPGRGAPGRGGRDGLAPATAPAAARGSDRAAR